MHWTIYATIILVLLAAAGWISRSLKIGKHMQGDLLIWKGHERDPFVIRNSSFHCKMPPRIGFLGGFLFLVGIGCFLPEWLGWLDPKYHLLLDLAGLAILVLGLSRMRIWPWSPAWLSVSVSPSAVHMQRADGKLLLDASYRASFKIDNGGISGEYEVPVHRAWQKLESRFFSIPGADIGRKNLVYVQFYMAKSGLPGYEFGLPEELRRLL
jgi:hypothetical protein